MQKAVVTAEQAKIQVGKLLMGSSFMTLDGKMGKLLEYIRETELVKVLVYEIGKDMAVEILWPLDVLVYTTPKQVPVPADVEQEAIAKVEGIPAEPWTAKTLVDIATDEERFEIMTPWGKATAVRKTTLPVEEPLPTSEQKHDPVNSPSHYTKGKIETIDFIEATGLGFHLGNAVKYLSRAGLKGSLLEDLKKTRWYVQRAIDKKLDLKVPTMTGEANTDVLSYMERYAMTKQLSAMQYEAVLNIQARELEGAVDIITRHICYLEADKI